MRKQNNECRRGRPKNSGYRQPYDAKLLPVIASHRLANPDQPLSTIIKKMIDTERDTGGVDRLRRAFRSQENSLMEAAKKRRQLQQIQEVTDSVISFTQGLQRVADRFAARFEAWSRSPEGDQFTEICKRFERAANSPEVRKWLALYQDQIRNTAGHNLSALSRSRLGVSP